MTKVGLVAKIAEDAGLTKVQAEKALNSFVAVTTAAIKAGDKVTLIGFGTFSAVTRWYYHDFYWDFQSLQLNYGK